MSQFGSLPIFFKIFDTKILPILTYGAEVWFEHESKGIEKIHNDFCKYVLKVSKYSPNVPVPIAQVVERPLREREVAGSKPGRAIRR